MKKYIFTDVITKETFELECYPYEVHNIELKNNDFMNWAAGRIIQRSEFNLLTIF